MLHALRDSYPDRRLVLVWHNVRYHHAIAVRNCAEQLGIQRVYLPPDRPDLIPIEIQDQLNDQLSAVHGRLRPRLA